MDVADTYITFVRQNQDILRERINDEVYIEEVFDVSAPSHLTLFKLPPDKSVALHNFSSKAVTLSAAIMVWFPQ